MRIVFTIGAVIGSGLFVYGIDHQLPTIGAIGVLQTLMSTVCQGIWGDVA